MVILLCILIASCAGFTLLDIDQNHATMGTEGLLLYNGGTVCDDAFTSASADVACKQLGFERWAVWRSGDYWDWQDTRHIGMDDFACPDGAGEMGDCSWTTSHNCGHNEDIFLTCVDGKIFELVDEVGIPVLPETSSTGLLLHMGRTVCDDGFEKFEANTICRMMGFGDALYWGSGLDWSINENYEIGLDDVNCSDGDEWSSCTYTRIHNCAKTEAIFMRCSKMGFMIVNSGGWEVGPGERGLLLYNGGTVCNDGFDDNAANAICDELGFKGVKATDSATEYSWQESRHIRLDDVSCTSSGSWSDCSYTTSHNCGHNEDVFLTCQGNVDGSWGSFGPWGGCIKECGGGLRARIRACDSPVPVGTGAPCAGDATVYEYCNTHPCPVDGNWGSFGPWGSCSKECGDGLHIRTRACNNPAPVGTGAPCVGSATVSGDCNTQPCPIHGHWGSYGMWGACSVKCGGGVSTQTRSCNNPAPAFGGNDCVGKSSQTRQCNVHICPVDGNWGEFGSWSSCSAECAGGWRMRMRECNNPARAGTGAPCAGSTTEYGNCNTQPCPIHGRWGSYGMWGACSVECGGGVSTQTRHCNNPTPAFGGEECTGTASQTKQCNTQICAVDGNWGSFGLWGECSENCGVGQRYRWRACNNPASAGTGKPCAGSPAETGTCNRNLCPVNGEWGSYDEWGVCDAPCGGGTRRRERFCNNPAPEHDGDYCRYGESVEIGECNKEPCWYDTIGLVDLHGGESNEEGFVRMGEGNICFPEYDYKAASLICASKGHGCVKSIQIKPGSKAARSTLWNCYEDATQLSQCNPFNLHWDKGDFCGKEKQLYLVCVVKEDPGLEDQVQVNPAESILATIFDQDLTTSWQPTKGGPDLVGLFEWDVETQIIRVVIRGEFDPAVAEVRLLLTIDEGVSYRDLDYTICDFLPESLADTYYVDCSGDPVYKLQFDCDYEYGAGILLLGFQDSEILEVEVFGTADIPEILIPIWN